MASDVEPIFKPEPTRLDERVRRLPTIAHYLAILRAGWIVITVTTVAGLVLGGWYASTIKTEWRGSTSVELPDVPVYIDLTNIGPPAKPTTIDTTGQLVFSQPVLEAVSRVTRMSEQEVYENLSISAYPLSRVLIVTLVAPSDWQAERGANTAAATLLAQRLEVLAGNNRDPVRDMIEKLRDRNRTAIADPKIGFSSETLKVQQKIRDIQENLAKYSTRDGRIVNRAAPVKRVPKHSELYLTTGAVSGFMVGVAWIWWRPPKPRDRGGRGRGSAVLTDDAVHKLREARHGRRDPILVGSRVDPSSV